MPEPEPLISYILSCHGNQGQYILDHYKEFQSYVRKKTEGGFHLTKDAGILSAHSLSNFDKATDVSTLNIVDLVTFSTEFNASIVDVFHDLRQFSVYFFSSPAISH